MTEILAPTPVTPQGPSAASQSLDALSQRIDTILRRATALGTVPGVTLAIATPDEVVYVGASGRLGADDPAPALPDSLFWLASQTKLLVAIATLQLVDEGRIGLDEPVGDHLPDIDAVPVADGFATDGTVRTRPTRARVTFRHLLTHTAGGGYPFFSDTLRRIQEAGRIPSVLSGRLAALRDTPWLFEPGTDFSYGSNIDWLGQALERVTGQKLDEILDERIIRPLRLRDTTGFPTASQRSRTLALHARDEHGVPRTIRNTTALGEDAEFFAGGHALFGTVLDYVRILQALLRGGELDGVRILPQHLVDEGLRNQLGELRVRPIESADPAITNDVDLLPGIDATWGWFGLINQTATPWGRSAGSSFWAGVANSYWWIDPERGIAGAIATQLFPFVDREVLDVQAEVERTVGDWAATEHANRLAS